MLPMSDLSFSECLRSRLWDRQGPTGLLRLAAVGMSAAPTDPWRSRQPALVLVDDRHRPDDPIRPRGDIGGGQGAV